MPTHRTVRIPIRTFAQAWVAIRTPDLPPVVMRQLLEIIAAECNYRQAYVALRNKWWEKAADGEELYRRFVQTILDARMPGYLMLLVEFVGYNAYRGDIMEILRSTTAGAFRALEQHAEQARWKDDPTFVLRDVEQEMMIQAVLTTPKPDRLSWRAWAILKSYDVPQSPTRLALVKAVALDKYWGHPCDVVTEPDKFFPNDEPATLEENQVLATSAFEFARDVRQAWAEKLLKNEMVIANYLTQEQRTQLEQLAAPKAA